MADQYTTDGLNAGADGIAAVGTYIAFFTDASDTEVSGGSYAREQTTWAAASGGSRVGSQITANIPASTTITRWGIYTAATGGTKLWSAALSASESFGSAGTYKFTPTITVANPA